MNNYISTNNPLKFFEEFFPKGFNDNFGNFFNLTTNEYTEVYHPEIMDTELLPNPKYMIECNENEDYIVYVEVFYTKDGNTGKRQLKKVLTVELEKILKQEIENALTLTNDAILERNSEDSQKTLVNILLSNMALVIDSYLPLISLKKYAPFCQSLLVEYIKKVELHYPNLISREKSTYLKYLTPKSVNASYSLNMISSKFKQLDKLLDLLKEEGFVEGSLSLELFKKAFDDKPIDKPLNIKWIKLDRKQTYLGGVTELMQQLKDKKYLGDFEGAQLSKIFVRADGSIINVVNWKSARTNTKVGKSGKRNKILYDIDYVMKNF